MSEYSRAPEESSSRRSRILGAVFGLVIAGCISLSPAEIARAVDPIEPMVPTFSGIYEGILLPVGCAAAFCHGAETPAAALQLGSREQAYQALVGVRATGVACADSKLLRVVPGDPASSLLLMKLTLQPPCGVSMPAPDSLLKESQIAVIRRWIELGAPCN